jgi:hypothetical protein
MEHLDAGTPEVGDLNSKCRRLTLKREPGIMTGVPTDMDGTPVSLLRTT